MNKETSIVDNRLALLRFELGILEGDKFGRFESNLEVLRRKKILGVAQQIVFLVVDRDGVEEALNAYESFKSGNMGYQLKDLKRNS